MTKEALLGKLIRMVADAPDSILGVLCDLVEKLSSREDRIWLTELKLFLRKETCWVRDEVIPKGTPYLRGVTTGVIPATDGQRTLAQAVGVFGATSFDSLFFNWGIYKKDATRPETSFEVFEQRKDGIMNDFFSSFCRPLDELCCSQEQIISFVENNPDKLSSRGATFFLIKAGETFFVAYTYKKGYKLNVVVSQLTYIVPWDSEELNRVVVPQLT
jgi:hypothetical protein